MQNIYLCSYNRWFSQSGTHKVTLKFTGPVVTAHPDVFDHPDCLLSTENFETISATVYPNPFNNTCKLRATLFLKPWSCMMYWANK